MPHTRWGNWTFNSNNACLEHNATDYQIPVDEMMRSAIILDWIFQICEKTWATSADIGDLVKAIEEILGRGVAASGIDRPIDPKKILSSRYGVVFD